MTDGDLARAIHALHVRAAKAMGRPWRAWEHESAADVAAQIRAAEKLQVAYGGSDAPSRGDAVIGAGDRESFDVERHNDISYKPPWPWTEWNDGCWVCRSCGAAAAYQLHNNFCRAWVVGAPRGAK